MPGAFDAELPPTLAAIADLAGPVAAYRLAEARGGTTVYIPRPETLTPEHWLVATVGRAAAEKIAWMAQGENLTIPLGPLAGNRSRVWRAIREGIAAGRSENEIARLAGVAGRTVRRHRAGDDGRPDQHTLL